MNKLLKGLVLAASMLVATSASASHIFITDISINGTALDSLSGPTNPTFTVNVGTNLNLMAGFYDHCGGTCSETWNLNFVGAGSIGLLNFSPFVTPSGNPGAPLYLTFSQLLSTVGSWTGVFEPVQSLSCPSYRAPNGAETGGGCGGPSTSLAFSLNVVPEPEGLALFALGLVGIAAVRRRKQ